MRFPGRWYASGLGLSRSPCGEPEARRLAVGFFQIARSACEQLRLRQSNRLTMRCSGSTQSRDGWRERVREEKK
jgi:hypothetical protein